MAATVRYQELPLSTPQLRRIAHCSRLGQLLALRPAEITKQLRARWRGLPTPLAKLSKLLLQATPARAALLGIEPWLLLEHKRAPKVMRGSGLDPADFEPERLTVWVPEPIPSERVEQSLRSIKQKAAPGMIEFYVAFGALRICEPPLAGSFELPTRDSLFPGAEDAIFRTWATTPKWKGSAVVYRAPNGDRLLLHPSGRTAWAQLERGEIVPFAHSFSEAIDQFRRRVDHCQFFDSWERR